MRISQTGIDLIVKFEGIELEPYLDSVNKPTIGIGSTYYEDGSEVSMSDPKITLERAYELFKNNVKIYEKGVSDLVKVPLNQNQFDALVSFSYNLGVGNLGKSTLLKLLNNKMYEDAAKEFTKWNKAGGKVLAGLTRRREAERNLFLKSL